MPVRGRGVVYGGLGGVRIWSVVAEGAVVLFCERGALALVLLWPELCCTANPPPPPPRTSFVHT